jgi:ribosome-binding factor A
MSKHRHRDADASAEQYFSSASVHFNRKSEQLRAAIERALTTAVDCDLDDPALADLRLVDVVVEPGGAFAALFATDRVELGAVEQRLRDAAPVLRLALARSLARKRVPQVSFHVVPLTREVRDDE